MLRREQNRSHFASKTSWLLFEAEVTFSVSFVTSYSLQAGLRWGIRIRRELMCLMEDCMAVTLPFRARVNKAREDATLPGVPHGPPSQRPANSNDGEMPIGKEGGMRAARWPSQCFHSSQPREAAVPLVGSQSHGATAVANACCSTTEQPGLIFF